MDQISPEQNEQLKNWSSQRDSIVADLHINTEENNKLVTENKALRTEKTQLENEIVEYKKILSQKDFLISEINRLTPINQNLERINRDLNETILAGQNTVNLKSWVSQRDALLTEISNKKCEKDKLNEECINLSDSSTEITTKIIESRGRLDELTKKEEEFSKVIKTDTAYLILEKTDLQTKNEGLKIENKLLEEKKNGLLQDVANITGFHDHIFEKVNNLEGIVSKTIAISTDNAKEIESVLRSAGAELKKVVDIGEANVNKTNKLVLEIPKIIVDLHRDIIERRKINRVRVPKLNDLPI